MAEIVVFEDSEMTHELINAVAEIGNHEIIARAWSISEAHILLGKMALGKIRSDYTLLDGTLDGSEEPTPDFVFQPQGEHQVTKRSLFGRDKISTEPMEPIVVPARGDVIGRHGRQISEAIRTCNIPTTVIGISSNPAEDWGGDVDYDLTKLGIGPKLLKLIESIEATKNT